MRRKDLNANSTSHLLVSLSRLLLLGSSWILSDRVFHVLGGVLGTAYLRERKTVGERPCSERDSYYERRSSEATIKQRKVRFFLTPSYLWIRRRIFFSKEHPENRWLLCFVHPFWNCRNARSLFRMHAPVWNLSRAYFPKMGPGNVPNFRRCCLFVSSVVIETSQ